MQNRFGAYSSRGKCVITKDGRALLEEMWVELCVSRGVKIALTDPAITVSDKKTVLTFHGEHVETVELTLSEEGGTGCVSVSAKLSCHEKYLHPRFDAHGGMILHARVAADRAQYVGCTVKGHIWWQYPIFAESMADLPAETQSLLAKDKNRHVALLPLVSDRIRAEIDGESVVLSSGMNGDTEMSGLAFAVTDDSDPYTAVETLFRDCRKAGWIGVPLRQERKYPEQLEGFGWCTWNAFYKDVTEEKLFEKMEEFREKNVKIDWLLIDDGWSQYRDDRLWSFEEDFKKFPDGLAGTIRRLRTEYGVRYVGVWHALNGYWTGVHPDGPLARDFADTLITLPGGDLHVAPDEEKAFRFYDAWHTYLAAQGVDFIKVDNQSSYSYLVEEMTYSTAGVAALHRALDRSAELHFGGALINCMGAVNQDILTRPASAIDRNSNDFFPDYPIDVIRHFILQNAWTAMFHEKINVCDYDMFWTRHITAEANCLLRAMSGGPVYTSDPVGGTEAGCLAPLFRQDGSFEGRFPGAALPTPDCLYVDPEADKLPIKLFNCATDGALTVAAFGTDHEEKASKLRIFDIPGADEFTMYLAQNVFTKEYEVLAIWHEISYSVSYTRTAAWNLYPIRDGKVAVGDSSVYCGAITKKAEPVPFDSLLKK